MMKYIHTTLIMATIMLRCTLSMAAITVTPMQDPASLVETLSGEGIYVLQGSISYKGDPGAAGTFSNGWISGLDMNAGVIIRTGSPESDNVAGANTLEFDFTSETQEMSCQYVFATEEYDDTGMSIYPDILILYVDGKHVALLPDAVTPVSIRKLAEQNSTDLYDNRNNDFEEIEYSGFTKVLTAAAVNLSPIRLSHHFKLLVMNESDLNKHSAIFLEAGSCSATSSQTPEPDITPIPDPDPQVIPEPATLILVVLGLLGGLALRWRRR